MGLLLDGSGNLLIAELNRGVRRVDDQGIITTVMDGRDALSGPAGLAADGRGFLYVGDTRTRRAVAMVGGSAPITPVPTVAQEQSLPVVPILRPNYPNPFNRGTVIGYALPESGDVELAVYNLAGQQVAMLVDGSGEVGVHSVFWDGRDGDGQDLASGVYLYGVRTGDGRQLETRKMVLMK